MSKDDFDEEEKTPVTPAEKMAELMETLRAPDDIATSERITKPMRPLAIRNATNR